MPSGFPESALPDAVQGAGLEAGSVSAKQKVRIVVGMRLQSAFLLLEDTALLLCASVSLWSPVIPHHFGNVLC